MIMDCKLWQAYINVEVGNIATTVKDAFNKSHGVNQFVLVCIGVLKPLLVHICRYQQLETEIM